eukprot:379612-Prorocentrum_minimum.AAC.1
MSFSNIWKVSRENRTFALARTFKLWTGRGLNVVSCPVSAPCRVQLPRCPKPRTVEVSSGCLVSC